MLPGETRSFAPTWDPKTGKRFVGCAKQWKDCVPKDASLWGAVAGGMLRLLRQVSPELRQAHILNEKACMIALHHPFLVHLYATYKSNTCLYFLLEPVLGGFISLSFARVDDVVLATCVARTLHDAAPHHPPAHECPTPHPPSPPPPLLHPRTYTPSPGIVVSLPHVCVCVCACACVRVQGSSSLCCANARVSLRAQPASTPPASPWASSTCTARAW